MKRIHQSLLLTIIIIVTCISIGSSQDIKKYAHNSLAEKIYLQLDSDVYTTDKTIWFKAIILNATSHNVDYSSGVLYVDLINSESQIVESKLVKVKDGMGNGFFDLNRSFNNGVYLIRAYTEWNKNFSSDFVFETYVQIYSDFGESKVSRVIQNMRVIDTSENSYRILADIFPSALDSHHKDELKLSISQNEIQDSIFIDENKDGSYILDYDVPKSSKLLELEIQTGNNSKYKTLFSPNNDYLDLQFFPEGGKLLNGLSTKIAFKAIGTDGKSIEVEGEIIDDFNQTVTTFKSNSLGMGSFTIDDPKLSKTYKAKLTYGSKKLRKEVFLPKVKSSGYALSVIEKANVIFIKASHTGEETKAIILKGVCRGFTYFNKEAIIIDGKYIYAIPKKSFPDGIVAFKLFKDDMQPIAERLYFNSRIDGRIKITADIEKTKYEQREQIQLSIKTTDSDSIPIIAHASILGVKSRAKSTEVYSKDNLLSFFLMSSDLKGTIEQPSYYFKPGNEQELDHLMLTQGWTNYTQPLKSLDYKLEKNLNVSGVINKNKKAKKDELDLLLMTFDEARVTYTKTIKVPSSFNFDLEDMYGDEQDFVIQGAENWDKERKNYAIAIIKKKPLSVIFNYDDTFVLADSLITTIVKKNRKQKQEEDLAHFNTYGTTALDEVVISGYKMTPKRKQVFERYGMPEIVIDGEDLIEKERKFHSTGLYSILLGFFKDKITIDQDGTGLLSARVLGLPTLVIVDGIPVRPVFFPQLQDIMTSEVTSFEILETAKNFANLYATVYPGTMQVPAFGGIISIYTKRGIGLFGALNFPDKSLDLKKITVFSVEKEFYSPQHNSNQYYDMNTPDLRGLIYWNPKVVTDENGEAKINFYHSDDVGDFQLIIETITKRGKMGYKVVNYSVGKRIN
nr:hypothetical protein [uncultured Psychroserpens sp.]